MCPNCADARLNPCVCHKHAAEYRERAERNASWDREVAYFLALYRKGHRRAAEEGLNSLNYVGPETEWDYGGGVGEL